MIYFEETLTLEPPSPETLDIFVAFAQERMPSLERMGFRLAAAWSSDVDSLCQVTQVLEFDSMVAFEEFRARTLHAAPWLDYQARIEELAPIRRTRLLEPLTPVLADRLHEAWRETAKQPLGTYALAILQVAPGKMSTFIEGIEAMGAGLPIVASWRTIIGNQNEVTDVWRGPLRLSGYEPSNEGMNAFFRTLREVAPVERLAPVFALPYSPLR